MVKHTRLTWLQSDNVLHAALFALLFFIPLSSSLKSIALVISVVVLLVQKSNRQSMKSIFQQPWVWWMCGLLFWVIISCLWSPALWNEQGFVVEKYTKLVWMPLLMLGFTHPKTRYMGLHVFVAAMLITVFVSFVMAIGWIHTNLPAGSVFRNHIITGHMLAFASYVVGYYAIKDKQWRWAYILAFLLLSYEILFVSQGRTGYIMYAITMGLLTFQLFKRWQLLVAVVVLGLSGLLVFHTSAIMQARVAWIYKDLQGLHQGDANTSLGFRMQFQTFAYTLFKERPFIGNGSGALTYYFDERQPVPAWGKQLREPHNQYWLIAAEYGVVGLVLYFGWLVALILASRRLQAMKPFAFALLIPFIVGSFTDSLIFYSGCGYFFLTLMALCLGEFDILHRCTHNLNGTIGFRTRFNGSSHAKKGKAPYSF